MGPPPGFGYVHSSYGGQQLAPPPPVHGYNFNLPQPIFIGYAPPQGYTFPYGGLQCQGLSLEKGVPPVQGMPKTGHRATRTYDVASSPITPAQVEEGK